jgi:hypothetical protein
MDNPLLIKSTCFTCFLQASCQILGDAWGNGGDLDRFGVVWLGRSPILLVSCLFRFNDINYIIMFLSFDNILEMNFSVDVLDVESPA